MPSLITKPELLLLRAVDDLSHVASRYDRNYASANRAAVLAVIHDLQKVVSQLDKLHEKGE